MNDYAGNPALWPTLIPLIDDSDTPDASNFDSTGEALADRTAFDHALVLQAVNGVTGGTYTPSAPIIVGGQGMVCPDGTTWSIDGTLYFDGTGLFHPELVLDGVDARLVLQGSSTLQVDSNSSAEFQGDVLFDGSATVTYSCDPHWLSGASAVFEPGSILHLDVGAQLQLEHGDAIRIGDGTDPLFTTTRQRSIAQPFVFREQLPGTYFDTSVVIGSGDQLDKVKDLHTGGAGWVPLTKLVNGTTLYRITVRLEYASTGGPGNASISLYKTNLTTGVRTQITTGNYARSAGTSLLATLTVPPTETIDDSLYSYAVEYGPEFGGGAAAITWYAPTVLCTDIQYFRSI